MLVRVIAQSTLSAFWAQHPETKASLGRWIAITATSTWATPLEIQASFSRAKVLGSDRVRFEVAGGDYRLIVGYKFKNQIAFIKFIGTHAEYDRVDALTVSQF